jgi:isopenicillin N synthase-like dioxygenase
MESNYTISACILQSLTRSLHLPSDALTSLHRLSAPSGCHVRFITSPPLPSNTASNHALGTEHTDFGSLTILLNRLGGLQVQMPGPERDWVYVRPMKGCAIVNLGDAMVKFTGRILRSNLHRVVKPPGEQWKVRRQALVCFLRPGHDIPLARLKGGMIDELGEGGYEGVTSREWLDRRHIGRRIEFYTGKESWDGVKGTEERVGHAVAV